jgi:beta-glucosidase
MINPKNNASLYLVSVLLLGLNVYAVRGNSQEKPAKAIDTPRYRDASLPIQDRVADLLPRMTLEEKVQQISTGWEDRLDLVDPAKTFTAEEARKIILNEWGPEMKLTPRQFAILRNGAQRYFLEKTRLGIPAIFYSESLHGLMEYGSTSFPQALGLASTWDPALVKRVFTAAGDEAGSRGVDQVYTPVLDIARDPRWGRTEETYGEDPYLVSRIGVAAIEGCRAITTSSTAITSWPPPSTLRCTGSRRAAPTPHPATTPSESSARTS